MATHFAELQPDNPVDQDVQRKFEVIASQHEEFDGIYHKLVPSDEFKPDSSLETWAIDYFRGLGRAGLSFVDSYLSSSLDNDWPAPDRYVYDINGHERTVLATVHRTDEVEDGKPYNMVLVPGLGEFDLASHRGLHMAMARRHPERNIYTILNPGLSVRGTILSIGHALSRTLEETAAENIEIARRLVEDEPTKLAGTSLGSVVTTLTAAENLAANPFEQLNLTGVDLYSPAVAVKNINWDELVGEREADASDRKLVARVSREFYTHMVEEAVRMGLKHGAAAGEVTMAGLAYVIQTNKLMARAATIAGNLKGVQFGVESDVFKSVAQEYDLHALGGERCPILIATKNQYTLIRQLAPNTKLWEVEDIGHAMTLNANAVANTAADMEDLALSLKSGSSKKAA